MRQWKTKEWRDKMRMRSQHSSNPFTAPNMPPPPKRKTLDDQRYRGLWIYCDGCGQGQCLAIGATVATIGKVKQLQLLRELGWQIAPRKLCGLCMPNNLYWFPDSDSIEWNAKEDGRHIFIGQSKYKTVHEALRLWIKARPDDREYFHKCYKP